MFATPYCLVLVVWLLDSYRFEKRQLLWAFGAAFACWAVFFNAFGHIRDVLFYLGIGAYLLVILSNAHPSARVRQLAFVAALVVNSGLLLELLRRFLLNQWIG